jgi:hypothetical protein
MFRNERIRQFYPLSLHLLVLIDGLLEIWGSLMITSFLTGSKYYLVPTNFSRQADGDCQTRLKAVFLSKLGSGVMGDSITICCGCPTPKNLKKMNGPAHFSISRNILFTADPRNPRMRNAISTSGFRIWHLFGEIDEFKQKFCDI